MGSEVSGNPLEPDNLTYKALAGRYGGIIKLPAVSMSSNFKIGVVFNSFPIFPHAHFDSSNTPGIPLMDTLFRSQKQNRKNSTQEAISSK